MLKQELIKVESAAKLRKWSATDAYWLTRLMSCCIFHGMLLKN